MKKIYFKMIISGVLFCMLSLTAGVSYSGKIVNARPAKPKLSLFKREKESFTIKIKKKGSVTGYVVYICEKKKGRYLSVGRYPRFMFKNIHKIKITKKNYKKLKKNKVYYVKVKAWRGHSWSSMSKPLYVRSYTTPTPKPSASPTQKPTQKPSAKPTTVATSTVTPTTTPTVSPTATPAVSPTVMPVVI